MSYIRSHSRLLLVAVSCATLGAGASAIASAGATAPHPAHRAGAHGARGRGFRRLAMRAVSGQLVVATPRGFGTVTFERGLLRSVSGRTLTIAEGTKKATYRTVTVTLPAGAVVRDDRHTATFSSLTPGQRVTVVQAPKRTLVIARTPKHA